MIPQFTLWVQKVTFVRSCNCSLYMYHGCWCSLEQNQGFLLINFIRVNSLRGRCKREEGRRRKVCKGKGRVFFSSLLISPLPFLSFPLPFRFLSYSYDLIDRIDRLIDRKAKEVMGNEFFVSNHIILVYMFCLISIGFSLSDEANKMKFLNIERT